MSQQIFCAVLLAILLAIQIITMSQVSELLRTTNKLSFGRLYVRHFVQIQFNMTTTVVFFGRFILSIKIHVNFELLVVGLHSYFNIFFTETSSIISVLPGYSQDQIIFLVPFMERVVPKVNVIPLKLASVFHDLDHSTPERPICWLT